MDIILGADCWYHEGDFQDLLHTISYFMSHNHHCRYVGFALLMIVARDKAAEIIPICSHYGLSHLRCSCLMAYHDRGAETLAYSLKRWGLRAVSHSLSTQLAEDDTYSSIHIIEVMSTLGQEGPSVS